MRLVFVHFLKSWAHLEIMVNKWNINHINIDWIDKGLIIFLEMARI